MGGDFLNSHRASGKSKIPANYRLSFREHKTPVWSLPLGNLAYPLEAALWLASGITLAGVK